MPACSRRPTCRRATQVALRLCSSAGEALPREIGERFTRHFGCEIIDGLGSTEMLHIFLSNRPGDVHYGSTGKRRAGLPAASCVDANRAPTWRPARSATSTSAARARR